MKALLGDDLLLRPRHGRIRLGGKWIHFPLKLTDALMRLPKPFAASLIGDMVPLPPELEEILSRPSRAVDIQAELDALADCMQHGF